MEASERFKILNEFLGWGNPNNAIWFVGIEEGGDWSKKGFGLTNKPLREYENKVNDNIINNYVNNVNEGVKNLKKEEILSWKDKLYKNINDILNNDKLNQTRIDNIFISNLFPLGVKSTKCETWVEVYSDYKDIFNLRDDEYQKEKYYERSSKDRFIALYKLRERYNPLLTICYGIDQHSNFVKCFNIKTIERQYESRGRYFISEDQTLIIINHLSYPPNVSLFKSNHLDFIKEKYDDRTI